MQNMDQYFEVDSFRSLCCGQRWFNFTCARVVCVWRDYARKRLIVMFVDKNREKMMAVVPTSLMQRYKAILWWTNYVVGKVISWRFLGFNCVFELLLQDHSGFVIKLILNDGPGRLPGVLARAFIGQWVIYVSHVKYREWGGTNYLYSTHISKVVSLPVMPEAEANRNLLG
ncbi:hypothetical protein LXL04_024073 [Taraxacum kok-saghyz]